MAALRILERRLAGKAAAAPAAIACMAGAAANPLEHYIRTGSQEAFTQIVHGHGRAVLVSCLHVLGNLPDAEDAAQEAFLALAQHAERARGNLAGWLHTVARRKAIHLLHSRVARSRREEYAAAPETGRMTGGEGCQGHVQEELLAAV